MNVKIPLAFASILLVLIGMFSGLLWFFHGVLLTNRRVEPPCWSFALLVEGVAFHRSEHDVSSTKPIPDSSATPAPMRWKDKERGRVRLSTDIASELYLKGGYHERKTSPHPDANQPDARQRSAAPR